MILASHLGRPKGKPNPGDEPAAGGGSPERAARPRRGVRRRLHRATGRDAPIASQPAGGVVLLENLRFHAEEEKNDAGFAQGLAALADVYVNDAFGAAHRAHASVDAIVRLVPRGRRRPADGEGAALSRRGARQSRAAVRRHARRRQGLRQDRGHREPAPARRSAAHRRRDGLHVLQGAWASPSASRSSRTTSSTRRARSWRRRAKRAVSQLLLPVDHVVAPKLDAGAPSETLSVDDPAIGDRMGLDIGPQTAQAYAAALRDAKTVVWNGPMGVFEIDDVRARHDRGGAGRRRRCTGTTIVGGGDSIAAVKKAGVTDRITHISTGGGASLEFLGGQTLPGVAALPDQTKCQLQRNRDAHSVHRRQLEDVQDGRRDREVRQGVPRPGEGHRRRRDRPRAAVHRAARRGRGGPQQQRRDRRAGPATGSAKARSPARSARR